ncbi:hypothetical protein HMPREF1705_04711 [Acetomicrobium hydrogeniformans ATCC BAA-1850]|uniref:Uncharacterized protein n=1 Tax=Acetomicrobium hydrogeniformans ATCC BAA-1850 TaxID=592015 RepID=A0A0T5XD16_9BACT|nr:hypothetical protein HMPREF1705_04711 [Acetomicrobium hydrogeniformans ATCC BAA-1850]
MCLRNTLDVKKSRQENHKILYFSNTTCQTSTTTIKKGRIKHI